MKVIIAGSRTIDSDLLVEQAVRAARLHGKITEVVSGRARGVDLNGENYANKYGIPIKEFAITPQMWKTQGKSAGHRRNREMGDYADAAVILWDGVSNGAKGMGAYMFELGKPRFIFKIQVVTNDDGSVMYIDKTGTLYEKFTE